jgi:hypothetical protein
MRLLLFVAIALVLVLGTPPSWKRETLGGDAVKITATVTQNTDYPGWGHFIFWYGLENDFDEDFADEPGTEAEGVHVTYYWDGSAGTAVAPANAPDSVSDSTADSIRWGGKGIGWVNTDRQLVDSHTVSLNIATDVKTSVSTITFTIAGIKFPRCWSDDNTGCK